MFMQILKHRATAYIMQPTATAFYFFYLLANYAGLLDTREGPPTARLQESLEQKLTKFHYPTNIL